jgi:hypothetical protein
MVLSPERANAPEIKLRNKISHKTHEARIKSNTFKEDRCELMSFPPAENNIPGSFISSFFRINY